MKIALLLIVGIPLSLSILMADAQTSQVVPAHFSYTYNVVRASYLDFKQGIGLADPSDEHNPCTFVRYGLSASYRGPEINHFNSIGTNFREAGFAISHLSPPLSPVPSGWLNPGFTGESSTGIPLMPCPLPGSGPGNIWLIWSGMNWQSLEHDSASEINLCTYHYVPSIGCFPIPGTGILIAAVCDWRDAEFQADYSDENGKFIVGYPFDLMTVKSDAIVCPSFRHVHDYSHTVLNYAIDRAWQDFEVIENEDVVHYGTGTAYMVVCWKIDYYDFYDFDVKTTYTHDWKLVLDMADPPNEWAASIFNHLGSNPPAGTIALQGVYSLSPTMDGENGFPCPTAAPPPEESKPSAII